MIEISKVKRVVIQVIVVFDNRIKITFQRTKEGIVEISRELISGDRLVDKEQLWIPQDWYVKIKRQIMAIFNGNC